MFNEEKIVLPSIAHFQSIARGGKTRVFQAGFPGGGFFVPTLIDSVNQLSNGCIEILNLMIIALPTQFAKCLS